MQEKIKLTALQGVFNGNIFSVHEIATTLQLRFSAVLNQYSRLCLYYISINLKFNCELIAVVLTIVALLRQSLNFKTVCVNYVAKQTDEKSEGVKFKGEEKHESHEESTETKSEEKVEDELN